jgi:CRISPR-associated endoribonuclease Cas6
MEFEVQGSPELLGFAYEAGIGEKNAMGFGCLQCMG